MFAFWVFSWEHYCCKPRMAPLSLRFKLGEVVGVVHKEGGGGGELGRGVVVATTPTRSQRSRVLA